jgi:catechol 2,3-dioxygenase-like lactoylglutathione lyase family enzyme
MIKGLAHFSLTVSRADEAGEWYVRNFGFVDVHHQRQDNSYTRQLVGIDSAILNVVYLRFPGDPRTQSYPLLELIEYVQPRPAGEVPVPGRMGFSHLSLVVDDIHAEYRRLHRVARFRSPPVAITCGVNEGGYVCYLFDHDGNGLELFQPAAGRSER